MVGDDVARHAREQRRERGLALGRPAVEQLAQALATGGHQSLDDVLPAAVSTTASAGPSTYPSSRSSPMRAATRAGSTACAAPIAKASVGACSPTRASTQTCAP